MCSSCAKRTARRSTGPSNARVSLLRRETASLRFGTHAFDGVVDGRNDRAIDAVIRAVAAGTRPHEAGADHRRIMPGHIRNEVGRRAPPGELRGHARRQPAALDLRELTALRVELNDVQPLARPLRVERRELRKRGAGNERLRPAPTRHRKSGTAARRLGASRLPTAAAARLRRASAGPAWDASSR